MAFCSPILSRVVRVPVCQRAQMTRSQPWATMLLAGVDLAVHLPHAGPGFDPGSIGSQAAVRGRVRAPPTQKNVPSRSGSQWARDRDASLVLGRPRPQLWTDGATSATRKVLRRALCDPNASGRSSWPSALSPHKLMPELPFGWVGNPAWASTTAGSASRCSPMLAGCCTTAQSSIRGQVPPGTQSKSGSTASSAN